MWWTCPIGSVEVKLYPSGGGWHRVVARARIAATVSAYAGSAARFESGLEA